MLRNEKIQTARFILQISGLDFFVDETGYLFGAAC